MEKTKRQHICAKEGCNNPTKQLTATKWRTYCSRECLNADRNIKNWKEEPAPKCAICNNSVKSKRNGKWTKCCSPACSRILQSQQAIKLTIEEVLAQIDNIPADYNWRKFRGQYATLYLAIKELTAACPASWQVKQRISWLRGECKSKLEIVTDQIASLHPSAKSLSEARAKSRGTLVCSVCGGDRLYDAKRRRYPKFCSEACVNKHEKSTLIKKLIKLLKTQLPRVPHNKRIDVNDPAILYDMHVNQRMSKTEIAAYFKVDRETVTNRFAQYNIELHRYSKTSIPQKEISDFITNVLNLDVKQNVRSLIPSGEIDILVQDHNLAIEYCGLYWHSTQHARITANTHAIKYQQCKEAGIQLLTIFEDEWLDNKERVLRKIAHSLGANTNEKLHARKCIIKSVNSADKAAFFNINHIQGNGPSSINYGLYFNEKLVACIGFIKQQDGVYVLNRYATSHTVRGGFTKLLNHFKNNNVWSKIITFADLRWSNGSLYESTGFVLDKVLPPDYAYVNKFKRIHKFNMRRANLKKLLSNFNPDLSEVENCKMHNYYQIFDCGKLRYVMSAYQS